MEHFFVLTVIYILIIVLIIVVLKIVISIFTEGRESTRQLKRAELKLYTVGDIAEKLGIKTARAAYILRTLAEEGKVVPVVETTNTKFYDEETIKLARQKNKTVRRISNG